jgi:hypothetical protein
VKTLLTAALAFALSACSLTAPRFEAPPRCNDIAFPYADGWLGGDAAYSIPLPSGKTAWLFGDSFVAPGPQQNRVGSDFINNSIALSDCGDDGRWRIDYHWGPATEERRATAFLEADTAGRFWWLFDGFVYEGELYIGLLEVEKGPPRGPLNLPFHYHGMKLARVANPEASPEDWDVTILPLSRDRVALPGSSMVVQGDFLWLFTFIDRGATDYPRMLARLPLRALDARPSDPSVALTYLARDGSWKPGLDAADAKILMEDNASEMSVRYNVELGAWLAIYGYPDVQPGFPAVPPSDTIYARTAASLEGPWSAPRAIYRIPELDPGLRRNEKTICYAAKEHPEFEGPGELVLTYVCNLFTPSDARPLAVLHELNLAMDLYRPVVVRLPLNGLQLTEE